MNNQTEQNEDIKKLGALIKDIKIAMLTTVQPDGSLRSRPMATQKFEFDGDLWFFTSAASHKVDEIEQTHQVNLSYANPDDHCYVSVSGRADMVHDSQKIKQLWNPIYKAWFPKGLEDPDLALLKVGVERAEYWDSPGSAVVHLVGFIKSLVTGERRQGGDHEQINLKPTGQV